MIIAKAKFDIDYTKNLDKFMSIEACFDAWTKFEMVYKDDFEIHNLEDIDEKVEKNIEEKFNEIINEIKNKNLDNICVENIDKQCLDFTINYSNISTNELTYSEVYRVFESEERMNEYNDRFFKTINYPYMESDIEGRLSYIDLAYSLGKIFDKKESCYLNSKDKKINLLCLSNSIGTAVLDLNDKKFFEISRYSKIEDIVDFTSTLYDDIDLKYNIKTDKIFEIIFHKFQDDTALLSVDDNDIIIPDYFLPENLENIERKLSNNLEER